MDFNEVISNRHCIRNYRKDAIPDDILLSLQKALQAAPTSRNTQDFKFVFITDRALIQKFSDEACGQDFPANAPLIVAAVCDEDYSFNAAIAIDHMVLQAVNHGLGTCWLKWFDEGVAKKLINVPEKKHIPIIATVGYSAEAPVIKEKKPLSELISYNSY